MKFMLNLCLAWADIDQGPRALARLAAGLQNDGLAIRIGLLMFESAPEAVLRLADSGEPDSVGERFRCAPQALGQLKDWASAETTLTLGAARRDFRLLARVSARANADDTLLAGLRCADEGLGVLLLDPLGTPLTESVLERCGTLLRPFCRQLLVQQRRHQEELTQRATQAAELEALNVCLLELRTALAAGASPPVFGAVAATTGALDAAMRTHIEAALRRTRGRVSGPRGAARMLAINPNTLRARMRKLEIEPRRFAAGAAQG